MKFKAYILALAFAYCFLLPDKLLSQVQWTAYTMDKELNCNAINTFMVDSVGNIWLGTNNGLWIFDGMLWNGIQRIDNPTKNATKQFGNIIGIWEDTRGNTWATSDKCLFYYSKGYWIDFVDVVITSYFPRIIFEDHNSNIWVGFESVDKLSPDPNATTITPTVTGSLNEYTGQFWLNYDDKIGGTVSIKSGESYVYFTSIIEDHYGALWVATVHRICEIDSTNYKVYDEEYFGKTYIYTVVEDSNQNIWAGTETGALRFDGKKWIHYGRSEGLSGGSVRKIQVDKKGNLWAFTQGNIKFSGLGLFDGTVWHSFTSKTGLPEGTIKFLKEDGKGNTWGMSKNGISSFDGKIWKKYGEKDGLGDKYFDVFVDSKGTVWVGSNAGIFRFKNNQWESAYKPPDSENDLKSVVIWEDKKGNVWAGVGDKGIIRFDGDKVDHYDASSGLADNEVHRFFEDKSGNIWAISKKGISRFNMH